MKSLKKHLSSKGHTTITEENSEDDGVVNYCKNALGLCYLAKDFVDARKRGDGERICRLYKYLLLYYKLDGRTKYSYQTLHLLAQINFLLPPGLAHELKWNRFVNNNGYPDSNIELDRELEHRNKYFKADLKSYRGKITEKSVDRCSKSYNTMQDIIKNFDTVSFNKTPSGRHTVADWTDDVKELFQQFKEENLFKVQPGRNYSSFPGFPKNYLSTMNLGKLKCWLYEKLEDFDTIPLYKKNKQITICNISDV